MKSLARGHVGSEWWKPGSSSYSPAEAPCSQGNGSIRPSHVSWTQGRGGVNRCRTGALEPAVPLTHPPHCLSSPGNGRYPRSPECSE